MHELAGYRSIIHMAIYPAHSQSRSTCVSPYLVPVSVDLVYAPDRDGVWNRKVHQEIHGGIVWQVTGTKLSIHGCLPGNDCYIHWVSKLAN